jgi:hypothetical protein
MTRIGSSLRNWRFGRNAGFVVLVVLLLAGCPAFNEPDHEIPAPPSTPKEEERLGAIFTGYEKALLARKGIRYRFKRTEFDPAFDTRQVFSGEVVLNNPDLYRVELRDGKGQLAELYAWNGNEIYDAKFHRKETNVFQASCTRDSDDAKRHNQYLDGFRKSLTGLYVGLPVEEVKTMFYIRLEKEEKDWIYLELLPRTTSMKASYSRMRVVLDRKTFRIRQIWCEQPNGSAVTSDFEEPIKEKQPITEEALLQDFPKEMVRFPNP